MFSQKLEQIDVGGAAAGMEPSLLQRQRLAEQMSQLGNQAPKNAIDVITSVYGNYRANKEQDAIEKQMEQQRQQMAQILAQASPQMAQAAPYMSREQMAEALMKANQPQAPIKLGAGETIYNPNTGRADYTAPDKGNEITPYQAAQLDLERQKMQTAQQPSITEQIKLEEQTEKKQRGEQLKDTAARLVNDILASEDALRSATGPISSMTPTLRGDTADVENKINQLRSILTAENLGLMTGVLSETDLKVIAAIAGGGISTSRSEEGLIQELKRLQGTLKGEASQSQPQGSEAPIMATNPQTGETIQLVNGQWVPVQ